MKLFALDIGDVWTGTAISDALGMFARPYQTVPTTQLNDFLKKTLALEPITTIIVGYPKTMRGTRSEQTTKIEAAYKDLEQQFPSIQWILWDERLSSKRADALKKAGSKDEKIQSHSRAAAFILASYLDYKQFHTT